MSQHIIYQAHKSLLKCRKTISIAESCTGGLLSTLLTELSGSSKYFYLGLVTYSNIAKSKILGVPGRVIAKSGAVSAPVARLMAEKVRNLAKTDLGIGITGIAGPTGGTSNKPVGTVFIAVADRNNTICNKFSFKGTRSNIRRKSALSALKMLKGFL